MCIHIHTPYKGIIAKDKAVNRGPKIINEKCDSRKRLTRENQYTNSQGVEILFLPSKKETYKKFCNPWDTENVILYR
jgi:hypothetical protein